MLKLLKSQKKE